MSVVMQIDCHVFTGEVQEEESQKVLVPSDGHTPHCPVPCRILLQQDPREDWLAPPRQPCNTALRSKHQRWQQDTGCRWDRRIDSRSISYSMWNNTSSLPNIDEALAFQSFRKCGVAFWMEGQIMQCTKDLLQPARIL